MTLGQTKQGQPVRRFVSLCVLASFILSSVLTPQAIAATPLLGLPEPGTLVNLSPAFNPVMVKGLTVHPENPLMFDFIVSSGQTGLKGMALKDESQKLIKYFLACLTVPEKNWWVNLSPYEKDRIVPEDLGQTDLGRDMLAQDYVLKQITASLIYPEKKIGKDFWDKVYAKSQAQFGTTQIPVNTFNKVWVLADKADVVEHNNTAFVMSSHLKVMLDEDYLAMTKNKSSIKRDVIPAKAGILNPEANNISSQIIRDIVIPELEKEVNTGKNFSQLRQIYNSLILATWFKTRLKDALLNQVYADQGKVNGIDLTDKTIKDKIYDRYLSAYKKGVFNYIKEEVATSNKQPLPRKYFSGGILPVASQAMTVRPANVADGSKIGQQEDLFTVPTVLTNPAMNAVTVQLLQEAFSLGLVNAREIYEGEKTADTYKGTLQAWLENVLGNLKEVARLYNMSSQEVLSDYEQKRKQGSGFTRTYDGGANRLPVLREFLNDQIADFVPTKAAKAANEAMTTKKLVELAIEKGVASSEADLRELFKRQGAEARFHLGASFEDWLSERLRSLGAILTSSAITVNQLTREINMLAPQASVNFSGVNVTKTAKGFNVVINLPEEKSAKDRTIEVLQNFARERLTEYRLVFPGSSRTDFIQFELQRLPQIGSKEIDPQLAAKVESAAQQSRDVIARMMEANDSHNEQGITAVLEEMRVPLEGTKGSQPFLFTITGEESTRNVSGAVNTVASVKAALASTIEVTDEEAQRILNKTVFTNFDSVAQSERNGLIYEAALKAGLLGKKFVVTNIKRFSSNSHLAYIQFLQKLANEYNGNIVFVLSIEESPDVLKGDGAGMTTAIAAANKVFGSEFMATADIDIITDGGLKERGGNITGKYGYNGLMPTAFGVEYYRRALLLLGKLRLQHKNFGENRVFWTASDGDYDLGNVRYGNNSVSQLENDGSWNMMIHGAEEALVNDDEKAALFTQIQQAQEVGDWDNIEGALAEYPLIKKALDVILIKKLHELGENFADQSGKMKLFQEKPTPKQILLMLKEIDTNRIIPNAFLVVYARDAFTKQQQAYMTTYDEKTKAALREVGGSYFQFLIDAQYNPKAIEKVPVDIQQVVKETLHKLMPKENMLAASLGSVGRFTDRGKTQFLSDAYWDELALEREAGRTGLNKRGKVYIAPNITIRVAEGATVILDNVHITSTSDAPIEITLPDNTFMQNSILRLDEGVDLQPKTAIVDSRISGKIDVQGGNTVVMGVQFGGETLDFTDDAKWERPQALQLFQGQTVVSIITTAGERYLNRTITKAGYKGEPKSKMFAQQDVAKNRLGLTGDAGDGEWIVHGNWYSPKGNLGIKSAKAGMDFVRTFAEIESIRGDISGADRALVTTLNDAIVLRMNPNINQEHLDALQNPKEFLEKGGTADQLRQMLKTLQVFIKNTQRSDVLEKNKERLQRGEKLVYRIPLRLFDGPYSSFDLWDFIKAATGWFLERGSFRGFEYIPSIAATITDSSDGGLYAEVTIEQGQEGEITYISPPEAYNVNITTTEAPGLNDKGRVEGGQKSAAPFIAKSLFGVDGIKITLSLSQPEVINKGGLEASNGFNAALFYSMRYLTGSYLSDGDMYGLGLVTANGPLSDLTGMQGWLAALYGNVRMYFVGLIPNKEGKIINPRGVIITPLFKNSEAIAKLQKHTRMGQANVTAAEYIKRTATLINELWTFMLKKKDPETIQLEQRALELGNIFANAESEGDVEAMVEASREYADIRDRVALKAINVALDYREYEVNQTPLPPKTEKIKAIAQELSDLIFKQSKEFTIISPGQSQAEGEKTIINSLASLKIMQMLLKKEGTGKSVIADNPYAVQFLSIAEMYESPDPSKKILLRTQSLYTWGLSDETKEWAKSEGISFFPLGAGGPQSNTMIEAVDANKLTEGNPVWERLKGIFTNLVAPTIGTKPMTAKWVDAIGKSLDAVPTLRTNRPGNVSIKDVAGEDAALISVEAIVERAGPVFDSVIREGRSISTPALFTFFPMREDLGPFGRYAQVDNRVNPGEIKLWWEPNGADQPIEGLVMADRQQFIDFMSKFARRNLRLAQELLVSLESLASLNDASPERGNNVGEVPKVGGSFDPAQNSEDPALVVPGGINFDPANLGMTVTKDGDGVKITVDKAMIERMKKDGVSGFTPVIINIVPITNIFPILGLQTPSRREVGELAGV